MIRKNIQRRSLELLFGVTSLVCFLTSIVEITRLFLIASYAYYTILAHQLFYETFLLIVLGCMSVIPFAVIYSEARAPRALENRRKGYQGRLARLVSHVPSTLTKTLAIESILILELSFMVTSHILWIYNLQDYLFYRILPEISITRDSNFVTWDCYCLAMLSGVVLFSFLEYAKTDGVLRSLVKCLQTISLVLLPLGAEILLFDRPEFGIRIMAVESTWNLSWFTNADLFYVSLAIALASTLALVLSRREPSVVAAQIPLHPEIEAREERTE